MKKGFKKEVVFGYHNDQREVVRWTIWSDTLNNDKKWLRLYVDAYNTTSGYVFGSYGISKPRTLLMPISDLLYQQIMDKDSEYDLYYDEDIEKEIKEWYSPSYYL